MSRNQWVVSVALSGLLVRLAGAGESPTCERVLQPGGQWPGIDAWVRAAAVFDPDGDGPSPEWIVFGGTMGTTPAQPPASRRLVAFDGTHWFDLPTPPVTPQHLVVHDGDLYLAGTAGLWRFEADTWLLIGEAGQGGIARLASIGPDLYVGGVRLSFGGISETGLARWDGVAWHGMVLPPSAIVQAIVEFGGELWIGGTGTAPAADGFSRSVARWNGSVWANGRSTLSSVSDFAVNGAQLALRGRAAMQVLEDGAWRTVAEGLRDQGFPERIWSYHGNLVFTARSGPPLSSFMQFDGETVSILPGSSDPFWGFGLVSFVTEFRDELVVGGEFIQMGPGEQRGIARWNGNEWRSFGDQGGRITAVHSYAGGVVLSGNFNEWRDADARHIVRWDGRNWRELGAGLNAAAASAVEVGGELVAAGMFTRAGEVQAAGLAAWNGSVWRAWPAAPPAGSGATKVLGVFEGALVAGLGDGIWKWDGAAWQRLGQSFATSNASSIVEFHGRLFAAGRFRFGGLTTDVPLIELRDGQWASVFDAGVGTFGPQLVVHDNRLYAAGTFEGMVGGPAGNILEFDGVEWRTAAFDLSGARYVHFGRLGIYALNNSYTIWFNDGSGWTALDELTDPVGFTTSFARWVGEYDGAVLVAGNFWGIRDQVSANFARWACPAAPGDLNCDGVVNMSDITAFVSALTNREAYADAHPDCSAWNADVDGNDAISPGDIGAFVGLLTE